MTNVWEVTIRLHSVIRVLSAKLPCSLLASHESDEHWMSSAGIKRHMTIGGQMAVVLDSNSAYSFFLPSEKERDSQTCYLQPASCVCTYLGLDLKWGGGEKHTNNFFFHATAKHNKVGDRALTVKLLVHVPEQQNTTHQRNIRPVWRDYGSRNL